MKDSQTGFIDLRMIIGLAVVFLGMALLIDNIDPVLGLALWRWWPAFLILIGLRVLIQPAEHRQQLTGTIIIQIGLLLLLNNFDLIALHWSIVWPAILVLVGLAIIFRAIPNESLR